MNQETTVQQFYAVVNGLDNALSIWRATVTEHWTASPAFPLAPTQVAGYPLAIAALRKALPDLHFHIEELVTRENFVAARCTITGTHQGEFMGIAPTNKRVSCTAMDIHRMEAGKIAETWHAEDFAKMVAQLKS
jgi:predicted ester cyclase